MEPLLIPENNYSVIWNSASISIRYQVSAQH